jgi:Sec-independent protein translocase protein TatA
MFELFQPTHLLFVLLVALAVFGPKRMIEVSRGLAQSYQRIQEFTEEIKEEMTAPTKEEPGKKSPSSGEKERIDADVHGP